MPTFKSPTFVENVGQTWTEHTFLRRILNSRTRIQIYLYVRIIHPIPRKYYCTYLLSPSSLFLSTWFCFFFFQHVFLSYVESYSLLFFLSLGRNADVRQWHDDSRYLEYRFFFQTVEFFFEHVWTTNRLLMWALRSRRRGLSRCSIITIGWSAIWRRIVFNTELLFWLLMVCVILQVLRICTCSDVWRNGLLGL